MVYFLLRNGGVYMGLLKRLPKDFFQKARQKATSSENPDDEIIPIKWSKDVVGGKKKAVVTLAKNDK